MCLQIYFLQFLIWSIRQLEGFAVIIYEAVGVRLVTFGSFDVKKTDKFELEVIIMAPNRIPDFRWNTV